MVRDEEHDALCAARERPCSGTLALPRDEVHLWQAEQRLCTPQHERRYKTLLSDHELERHARFVDAAAASEFLLGRALLRSALGSYLGIHASRVVVELSEHGKPRLAGHSEQPELEFSLSHSRGLVVCLFARECELGVDVEDTARRLNTDELAERFFHPSECAALRALGPAQRGRRFLEYWTLKEACLKALGTGLREPLDRFCFQLHDSRGPALVRGAGDLERWHVRQLDLWPRHVGAVALHERSALQSRTFAWLRFP